MKLFTEEDMKKLNELTKSDTKLIVLKLDNWLEKPDIELLGKLEIVFLEWRDWVSFELWLVYVLTGFEDYQGFFEEYEYDDGFDL